MGEGSDFKRTPTSNGACGEKATLRFLDLHGAKANDHIKDISKETSRKCASGNKSQSSTTPRRPSRVTGAVTLGRLLSLSVLGPGVYGAPWGCCAGVSEFIHGKDPASLPGAPHMPQVPWLSSLVKRKKAIERSVTMRSPFHGSFHSP